MRKHQLTYFLLILCVSCAQTQKKELAEIRSFVLNKEYVQAEEKLEKSSLKKDEKSKLLYEVYKAHLLYFQDKLELAAKAFNEASKTVDKLFTKSIKSKIASGLINDTEDVYYGALYERSLIYYYQSLVNLKLGIQTPQEQKKYFDRARSVLVAWDSFDDDIKRSHDYKSIQSLDFFRQYYAAEIHEFLGEKTDLEIALQLYKDAKENLRRVAPAYNYFGEVTEETIKLLQDKLNDKKVKLKTKLNENKHFNELMAKIELKILRVAKKIRPSEYRALKKQFKISDTEIKEVKQKIIFESGLINEVKAKDYAFNLNTAIDSMEDSGSKKLIQGIGVPIITYFAMGTLGLGYVSQHGDVTVYSEHSAGREIVKEVGVEFEIPVVSLPMYENDYSVIVENIKGEEVANVKLTPLGLINELSYINNHEFFDENFSKRVSRIGTKYAIAILAAYSTYTTMNENENTAPFAKAAAVGQYLISQKAIKETEKADVRHWGTLPGSIYSLDLNLEAGDYNLFLVENVSPESVEKNKKLLQKISIKKQDRSLFTHRIF